MKKTMLLLAAAAALSLGAKENLINVSWGDAVMTQTGVAQLDRPEKVALAMRFWRDAFAGRAILWRLSTEDMERNYKISPRYQFIRDHMAKCAEVKAIFDPIACARDNARKLGQLFLLYETFNDHGQPVTTFFSTDGPFPWQDNETIEHPDYQERDLAGNWHYGVLDLSNPAARKMMIDRLKGFVEEYDADGLYLCSRTHSNPAVHADQFGFGPEVVAEYKRRYGIDITADPRFDCRKPEFAPNSVEVENWRKLRGEYLVKFIAELRAALGKNRVLYVGLPHGGRYGAPFGNMVIDYDSLIERKLIDGLVLGVLSGRSLYHADKVPHKDRGYLLSQDDRYNVPPAEVCAKALSPACRRQGIKLFVAGDSGKEFFNAKESPDFDGKMFREPPYRTELRVRTPEKAYASGALTVEFFAFCSKAAPGRIVSQYGHSGPHERAWEIHIDKDQQIHFRVDCQGHNQEVVSDVKFPIGKWAHIAAVFDPAVPEMRLYIDGKPAGSHRPPANVAKLEASPALDVCFGFYAGNLGSPSSTAFDELRISSVARPQITVPTAPLAADKDTLVLLHFDDDAGKGDFCAKGFHVLRSGTPKLSPGVFGSALDMRR